MQVWSNYCNSGLSHFTNELQEPRTRCHLEQQLEPRRRRDANTHIHTNGTIHKSSIPQSPNSTCARLQSTRPQSHNRTISHHDFQTTLCWRRRRSAFLKRTARQINKMHSGNGDWESPNSTCPRLQSTRHKIYHTTSNARQINNMQSTRHKTAVYAEIR